MKRVFTLLLLLLCPIVAAARVISYAPYSDQLSHRGYHERTTRHFVLVEAAAANVSAEYAYNAQLVLYDSTGAEPPRVIFPKTGRESIRATALYQPSPSATPVILVITGVWGDAKTWVSRNYGRTWRRITELDGFIPHGRADVDRGGPWTHGISVPIRIGSGRYPFVVSYAAGVYAISATSAPKLLLAGPTTVHTLLGQNRAGTEFLISTSRSTLAAVDLNGRWRHIGNPAPDFATGGWLAPDGSAYTVRRSAGGKTRLHRYVNERKELIADYDRTVFAVPTYDFSGAWTVGYWKDTATALSRYTPATGLKTMWEDPAAPEIEALHPGASGDSVLIQVHRERAEQELPLIDPALAVWRIGEPAPVVYDELFLNEGPGKGFVHLDVEQAAKGAPFVFDSSFIFAPGPPPPPISSPPPSGGADVIQEWGVVRASLEQRLVIQGVTRGPDSVKQVPWTTDLVVYNPLEEKQKVAIEFVSGDGPVESAARASETITLDPLEIRVVRDALAVLFGVDEASGALHLLPAVGINALARMQFQDGNRSAGYTVQAVDFYNVASPRFPVTFAAALPGANFRSQLVLTDTSGQGIDALIQATDATGRVAAAETVLHTEPESVTRHEVTSVIPGGAIVQPVRGSLIAGLLSIDERTGDAMYFPPDLPASAIRTIPFVAGMPNDLGLTTELHLINLSPYWRDINIEVNAYWNWYWPQTRSYYLKPYETRVLKDVYTAGDMGRVRYWSSGAQGDASGVRVAARTYVTSKDGTYGTSVPALNSFQSITAGESLEIFGILAGFQVSLGLVELSPNQCNFDSTVTISIVDDRGNRLHTFTETVEPAGGLFIADLFKARNVTPPPASRIVVTAHDDWTLIGAYAILTDPTTGDPTYLGAQLGATAK